MKIDATDPKMPDWKRYMFPCDCGETDYLHFQWWDEEEPWEPYLEVTPAIWGPGLWGRIKAAVKILTGRPIYHGGIILNSETAGEFLDLLARKREEVNSDGKAEHDNEDEHIHQDADS